MTAPQLGRCEIDPAHPTVTFRTRHLFGLAPVRGTFAIRSGANGLYRRYFAGVAYV